MSDEASRTAPRTCIFVSAVSRGLAAARLLVANCLRVFHNIDVIFQETFGLEPGELLAVLRSKIDGSYGLLQLVGEAWSRSTRRRSRFGDVSFTQFEFLYARNQGKPTWSIQVTGACTWRRTSPSSLVPEESVTGSQTSRLREQYLSRLRDLKPESHCRQGQRR